MANRHGKVSSLLYRCSDQPTMTMMTMMMALLLLPQCGLGLVMAQGLSRRIKCVMFLLLLLCMDSVTHILPRRLQVDALGRLPSQLGRQMRRSAAPSAPQDLPTDTTTLPSSAWLRYGLLLSSFHDGLSGNQPAETFLARGLTQALLDEKRVSLQAQVEASTLFSPCNGPDIALLDELDQVDQALHCLSDAATSLSVLPLPQPYELRMVYIPTAMYALRSDSHNTPGQQRQRARADGKKRRDTIVQWLQRDVWLQQTECVVRVVTLDLDDGSIKQPEGPAQNTKGAPFPFPKNGKEALSVWKPHLVYVEGGNTFWLHYCMEKGNWTDRLRQVATQPGTVYCGSSAGAILAGRYIETACWKGWDDPSVVPARRQRQDWTGVPGLGLVGDASFFPHMDDSWIALVQDQKKTLAGNGTVWCLQDDQVLCVDGATQSLTVVTNSETCALSSK